MGRADREDKERCALLFSGPETLETSLCTEKHGGDEMSELTVGNYMTLNTASHNSMYHDGQGLCQHVLRIANGFGCKTLDGKSGCNDGETKLPRNGEQLVKVPRDPWGLKAMIDRDGRETSAELSYIDERIHSLPTKDAISKEFRSSGLFQPLVTRSLKGKGIVGGNQEVLPEFCGSRFGEMEQKMDYARNLASRALIRSSVNGNKHPFLQANHTHVPNIPNCGISLREWLKPRCCARDRAECLLLFRQVVELVDVAHSHRTTLEELRPSYFKMLPSNKVVYTGTYAKRESSAGSMPNFYKKRLLESEEVAHCRVPSKQQKPVPDSGSLKYHNQPASNGGYKSKAFNATNSFGIGTQKSKQVDYHPESYSGCHASDASRKQRSVYSEGQLEEKWYSSPEQMNGGLSTASSNIYSLGVLLFELFSRFESFEDSSATMLNLQHRILPPDFLSANPKEAGFCLWFLHPQPSFRPTTREILHSELCQFRDTGPAKDDSLCLASNEDPKSELLMHFLSSLTEQKQKHASKLVGDIESLEEDIKEVNKRYSSTISSQEEEELFVEKMEEGSGLDLDPTATRRPFLDSCMRLMRSYKLIDEAYFKIRAQQQNSSILTLSNKDSRKDQDRLSVVDNNSEKLNMNPKSIHPFGSFYEDLCKFARYNHFKVCGSLQIRDLLNSTNVVGSLSLDRDEDYIATAGVSKKIKVFEFDAILNDSTDIHYPVADMSNNSKLSCVCWNNHIKNYLASTDYSGIVKVWDVGTGQEFTKHVEHQKRAWSVDFSVADPMMFASGSDDCSLRLWTINERNSVSTIWNPANICCVQFSTVSSHFVVFGSADYKIYCYDLRQAKTPWSTLAGHKKTVSYVKFLDPMTLVSASTDSTIKLWDLSKTTTTGICTDACYLTLTGHANEKNFVGLSVLDGYVACGSETNEVFCYYKSLPVPITSYKFRCVDPLSGKEIEDDTGHFVSSVCWRRKSNMVIAGNSCGNVKVLQMV